MFRELNDHDGTAMALNNLGNVYYSTTDYARALRCYQESLSLYLSLGDDSGIASTFSNLALESADVGEVLQMVLENNSSQIARKSLTLVTHIEPNCLARIDPAYMSEAFDNLISNAIKYSPIGKQVTVRLQRLSHSLLIDVQDEGQGLTEEDKTKLFLRFQPLSAKPTGGESSTGLGLYIVKQIIEKHGGRVWAESDGRNKGSTFFVELPCA